MCKFIFNIIFNNFFTHILLIIICIFNEWVFILHCFLYAEWLKIHVLNSVGLSMRFVNMKNVFSIYIVKSLCWLHLNAIFSTIHFIFFLGWGHHSFKLNIFVKKLGLMYIGVAHAIDVLVGVTINFYFLDFKYDDVKFDIRILN